ncbi:arylsulfatase [Dyadobacter psychrophilus]|uniref:Arylsulfatase n=1 Tax=Dyadobacter psychrophilus TaxID=651661 RepID=A0A1T5DTN3_9BACT|nr:arylsulfatase [Dyadobacter psychrophilus]SKB74876.1 arylsulfatase [Dyadobacter psychrophilus]
MKTFLKITASVITGLLPFTQALAQNSPQQPWNGKQGKTLLESTPYKIEYNKKAPKGAPNVVWILIDDAGFGATTAFGGLVETPNIEKLANQGLRFTNFHTTAICSPTRAALLTGRNHHSTHVGLLTPAAIDFPGYDTYIPFEKATAAEVLRENGYSTFALGKWHLTPVTENSQAGPFNRWPTGRGFDHYYGFLPGATDQWHPELWEDVTKIDIEPNTKHLNELLADKAIKYIANQKSVDAEKPFFLYLATGATHSPHQVSKEWIDKYKGKFDLGWDNYREVVIEKQKKLGIIPQNAILPERNPGVKEWATLTEKEKKAYAHFMEVYAAFYSYTDYEIGRIVDYLEQIDQLDNTVIAVILGDNGASKGGTQHGTINPQINRLQGEQRIDAILNASDLIGTDESSTDYPIGWAAAANTPFRYWKADANTEGGTRNPMVLYYPKGIKDKGGIRHQYGHVIDILPTTLEIVKGESPKIINGYKQEPFEGTSLAYTVDNAKAPSKHTIQYYEIAGSRSIYKDGWKAGVLHESKEGINIGNAADPSGKKVDFSKEVWELYNLNEDFNENVNLAAKFPDKLKELQGVFDQEAKKYNVYPIKDFSAHDMPAGRTVFGKMPVVTLFPGVDNLVGVSSPLYDGRSFTVNAEAEIITGKEEGVLFAVGGDKSGISLFLKDGKFHYAHKTPKDVFNASSSSVIPKGKVNFKLVYEHSGPAEAGKSVGKETVYLNDEKIGERSFTATQAPIQGPRNLDGTDVGRDQKYAVSDLYNAPFTFTGKLKKVTITYN